MSHASDIVLGGLVLKLESYPLPSRRIHYDPIHIDSPLANEAFWTMNSPVLELKVVSPEYMRLPHPTTETKGHTYQQEVAFEPELIGKHKHLADVFGNEDEEHQFVPDKLVNPALLTPLPVLDILPNSNNRTGIMRRFVPDYENSVNLASVACGRNEDVPLSQLPQSKKLLVTCGELEFTRPELSQIEPLFPEICLYNYETGEVLSEVFHFDDNPTELLCTHLLESRIVQHVTSTSHHALFEIADLSSNVGLLVRVNRTLQGNPDVFNDYYCREKMSERDFRKLKSNAHTHGTRLGEFKQPFAWSFIHLFDENNEVLDTSRVCDCFTLEGRTLDALTFHRQVVFETTGDKRRASKTFLKNANPYLQIKFRIEVINENPKNLYTSLLEAIPDPVASFHETAGLTSRPGPFPVIEIANLSSRNLKVPIQRVENMIIVTLDSVNTSNHKNLSVCVELKEDDISLETPGCLSIAGSSSSPVFVEKYFSKVWYHESNPKLGDQVKIKLPWNISSNLHLFFTIYSVNCKSSKISSSTGVKNVIGYACIPIYSEQCIIRDGAHSLPIAKSLEFPYLRRFKYDSTDIEWIDNAAHKLFFTVKNITSLRTPDIAFSNLLEILPSLNQIEDDTQVETLLKLGLDNWKESADDLSFHRFLVPGLNMLIRRFGLSTSSTERALLYDAVSMVIDVVKQDTEQLRPDILQSYTRYYFHNFSYDVLYLSLGTELGRAISTNKITNCWFWMDLIIKSIVCYQQSSKQVQLAPEFYHVLQGIQASILQVLYGHRQGMGLTALKQLNAHWGLFVSDLFTVLDRIQVFTLIQEYMDNLYVVDSVILQFKLSFISIIFNNVSIVDILEPTMEAPVLQECLVQFVTDTITSKQGRVLFPKVIDVLQSHLVQLDYDASLTHEVKIALATSYLPLVFTLSTENDSVRLLTATEQRPLLVCAIWILQFARHESILSWLTTTRSPNCFFVLLQLIVQCFSYISLKSRDGLEFESLVSRETLDTILDEKEPKTDYKKNIEKIMSGFSNTSSRGSSNQKRHQSLGKEYLSTSAGGGTTNIGVSSMPDNVGGSGSRSMYLAQRRVLMQEQKGLRKNRKSTLKKSLKGNTVTGDASLQQLYAWESEMNTGVSAIILQTLIPCIPEYPAEVLDVVVGLLDSNQSDTIFKYAYSVLHAVLELSPSLLNSPTTTLLCGVLLRHCIYPSQDLRSRTVALLYIVARYTKTITGTYSMFQNAITSSLSSMLSGLQGDGVKHLQQALAAVTLLHKGTRDGFSKVMERVNSILRDTVEISRLESLGFDTDHTALEEALLTIADSYSHLPAVRNDWLTRLASHHASLENHAESAMCYLMQAELLEATKGTGDVESLYLSAALAFDKGCLYEECNRIYTEKLLPVYLDTRRYAMMAQGYEHLTGVLKSLVTAVDSKYRLLGTYYRVGFYGIEFKQCNGKQYVYKRPKITPLAEMMSYIKKSYQLSSPIQILSYSGKPEGLNPRDNWVQITYVTPYWEDNQLVERPCYIDRNTNISKFTFTTPFSSGSADNSSKSPRVKDQCLLVTVLHVPHKFPYVITRQHISQVTEVVLSPIESSTVNINKRIEELENVLSSPHPNKQKLGSLLQGSILLQVNGGIAEIIEAFFTGDGNDNTGTLRASISKLLETLDSGLEAYTQLSLGGVHEQKLIHELTRQFARMQTDTWGVLQNTKRRAKGGTVGVRFK